MKTRVFSFVIVFLSLLLAGCEKQWDEEFLTGKDLVFTNDSVPSPAISALCADIPADPDFPDLPSLPLTNTELLSGYWQILDTAQSQPYIEDSIWNIDAWQNYLVPQNQQNTLLYFSEDGVFQTYYDDGINPLILSGNSTWHWTNDDQSQFMSGEYDWYGYYYNITILNQDTFQCVRLAPSYAGKVWAKHTYVHPEEEF